MSWSVYWHPAALHGFYDLPMKAAERLDAAVIGIARTGRGPMDRDPRDPRLFRVAVLGAVAVIEPFPLEEVIRVWAVFRRRE